MVRRPGLEPRTSRLKGGSSTIELPADMVRVKGLEPIRLSTREPKSRVSTISPHPDMKVFTAWGYTYNPNKTPCYTAKAVRYNTSLSRRTYLVVDYPNGRWYQERDSNPYLAIISHLYWPVVRSRHKRWLCICPYNHQIRVDTLSALLTRFHHAGPLLCNCR